MTYRVIVTPAVESDLRTAYRYIRAQAPRAARDWIRRARQSAKSLARHPERCPLAPESASFDQPIRELFFGSGKRTHSLVMTSESKHIRFVDTVHIEGGPDTVVRF